MSKEKKDLRFDPGLLEEMQEPLTVRVEKLRGSARMPIDLPPREEGFAPGMAWDKDAVRRLESWLVNEWAGGGVYRILVVDNQQKRMEWEAVYDPRSFPERIPPTMNAVLPQQPAPPQPSQQGPQQSQQPPSVTIQMPQGHWPPFASGFQPMQMMGTGNGAMGAVPQPSPPGMWGTSWGGAPAPSWSPPPRVSAQAPSAPQPSMHIDEDRLERLTRRARPTPEEDFERKRLEEQTRMLQETVQRLERDRLEAEHKASLERVQQSHSQEMAKLQDEMRRIAERAQAVPVGPSPELQQLREEREKLERKQEQLEREHREAQRQAAAEKQASEIDRRFQEMMQLIGKMAEAPKGPTGPDPALLALQEQIRRQEDEMRREKERAERERDRLDADRKREMEKVEQERRDRDRAELERRDREAMREEIRRKEEETRRLIEEMRAAQNRGPDPLIEFMKESTRQQIESMKDLARQQQVAQQAMQGFMMPPRDIISMVKDSSNGMDTLQRNVMGIYNDIFQTQRMLIEQAAQLNGGSGDPASVRLIEQGISQAAAFAEKYVSAKQAETVSQARVQQAQVEAQGKAWQAQQAAVQAQAAYAAQAAAAQAAAGGGLNGAGAQPQAAPAKPKKSKRPKDAKLGADGKGGTWEGGAEFVPNTTPPPAPVVDPKRTDDGTTDPNTGATVAKVIQLRPLGFTDEQWFGPALDEVRKLRGGVNEFMISITQEPPRINPANGHIVGITPDQAIMMVLRAVNYVSAHKIQIKAFHELYESERFADFMDVLLPEAPIEYRADCVAILIAIAKEQAGQAAAPAPTGEVEDEEEDEEEDSEDEEYNDQDEE